MQLSERPVKQVETSRVALKATLQDIDARGPLPLAQQVALVRERSYTSAVSASITLPSTVRMLG